MKIAFVNQAIDTILPPYQSSVGACTYGAAYAFPQSSEVVVYGTKNRNGEVPFESRKENVQFRFLPLSFSDRVVSMLREQSSKFFQVSSPASSSSWIYREFGRQVARDLQDQRCDIIHLQHCSQYAPPIRALNPGSKIVLHLHAEWFSQN